MSDENVGKVVTAAVELCDNDQKKALKVLRGAVKMLTPERISEADLIARLETCLDTFGTVTVRLAAKSTGGSLRRCREVLKAMPTNEVDADTFTKS